MKKNVLSLVLVLVVSVLLVGCGSKEKSEYVNTKWNLYSVSAGGEEVLAEGSGVESYIEFKSKGKLEMVTNGETENATYKEDGDKLIITDATGDYEVTKDGDFLIIEVQGMTMKFKK